MSINGPGTLDVLSQIGSSRSELLEPKVLYTSPHPEIHPIPHPIQPVQVSTYSTTVLHPSGDGLCSDMLISLVSISGLDLETTKMK